jgi:hypothetical protein
VLTAIEVRSISLNNGEDPKFQLDNFVWSLIFKLLQVCHYVAFPHIDQKVIFQNHWAIALCKDPIANAKVSYEKII